LYSAQTPRQQLSNQESFLQALGWQQVWVEGSCKQHNM
jgi:hypothetical protein